MDATRDFVVLDEASWTSPPLAGFEAMAATIDERFGPPSQRELDSNGMGPVDGRCVRFACGLEVGLLRFHLGPQMRTIDPAVEPSRFEIYANQRDLAHIAFHVGVPLAMMSLWTDAAGVPVAEPPGHEVVVMRTDDNGNDVEVSRCASRCEAEAQVRAYEARGHKQLYWIAGGAAG